MFKIEKISEKSIQTNKITYKKRHTATFVKQNTIIRQKDKAKFFIFLTNDNMSKKDQ